jgi:hypothetical protein
MVRGERVSRALAQPLRSDSERQAESDFRREAATRSRSLLMWRRPLNRSVTAPENRAQQKWRVHWNPPSRIVQFVAAFSRLWRSAIPPSRSRP